MKAERWEYGWMWPDKFNRIGGDFDTAEEALGKVEGMRLNHNAPAKPAIRRVVYDEPLAMQSNPCSGRPGGSQDQEVTGRVQDVHLEHMRMRLAGMTEQEAWDAIYAQREAS